jgi:nitrogen permease regulator 2-like protein
MSIKAIFYSKFDTQEGKFPIRPSQHQPADNASGPKVIHQVPEGSIVPSSDPKDGSPFFSFSSISSFIIPRQSLCGNLISLVPPSQHPPNHSSHPHSQSYRILGHPICLTSSAYPRNEFIFNFCLVLSAADQDFNAYKSVVTKLANLMLSLEEQSHFLSRDTSAPNTGKVYSLCETLVSDLNNYCECMIPIDDLNTLNLKLFPTYAPPPPVKGWQVPIFTVRPESLMDENWDLTMQRVVPHINGVSSVKHIAILADADLGLTKQCIKHLLYYGCLLLLDVFSFAAIYAPTAEFATTIAADEDMQRECAKYVNTAFAPTTTSDKLGNVVDQPDVPITGDDIWPLTSSGKIVDGVGIIELFAALKQGQSVRQWYAENSDMLANIDLRRFITFGVIKGFVYRVHKYAFATNRAVAATARPGRRENTRHGVKSEGGGEGGGKMRKRVPAQNLFSPNRPTQTRDIPAKGDRSIRSELHHAEAHRQEEDDDDEDDDDDAATITKDDTRRKHIHHHSNRHRRHHRRRKSHQHRSRSEDSESTRSFLSSSSCSSSSDAKAEAKLTARLSRYLDGTHCFDQICTELEISETDLERRLRRWGNSFKGVGGGGGGGVGEVIIIHR